MIVIEIMSSNRSRAFRRRRVVFEDRLVNDREWIGILASFRCSKPIIDEKMRQSSRRRRTLAMSASNYDRFAQYMQNSVGPKFLDEALHPQSGNRALDFGCGTGNTTIEMAERIGPTGFLVGVDPNEDRISIAQTRLQDKDNVKIVHGSTKEAAQYAPYDVIFSNYVMHWIPAQEHAVTFRNIYDMLKPGGRFGFTTIERDLPGYIHDLSASQYENSYENFLVAVGWSLRPLADWTKLLKETGSKSFMLWMK